MYCHECGADVTYEDEAADRRDLVVRQVSKRVRWAVHAVVATVLLLSFALSLLYFWGNEAKGSTVVLLGVGAALETEQLTLSTAGSTIELPQAKCRGPLMLSFRYALAPPHCTLNIVLRKGSRVVHRDSLPASFLTGEGRFRIPVATLPPAPFEVDLLQGAKPIATMKLTVESEGS